MSSRRWASRAPVVAVAALLVGSCGGECAYTCWSQLRVEAVLVPVEVAVVDVCDGYDSHCAEVVVPVGECIVDSSPDPFQVCLSDETLSVVRNVVLLDPDLARFENQPLDILVTDEDGGVLVEAEAVLPQLSYPIACQPDCPYRTLSL